MKGNKVRYVMNCSGEEWKCMAKYVQVWCGSMMHDDGVLQVWSWWALVRYGEEWWTMISEYDEAWYCAFRIIYCSLSGMQQRGAHKRSWNQTPWWETSGRRREGNSVWKIFQQDALDETRCKQGRNEFSNKTPRIQAADSLNENTWGKSKRKMGEYHRHKNKLVRMVASWGKNIVEQDVFIEGHSWKTIRIRRQGMKTVKSWRSKIPLFARIEKSIQLVAVLGIAISYAQKDCNVSENDGPSSRCTSYLKPSSWHHTGHTCL